MSSEKTQDSSARDFEDLNEEPKSNDLVGWVIAIVITCVAIYAVPTVIGYFM